MANVIIPNQERKADAEHVMKKYGADRNDPAMREAAEVIAARTNETIKTANQRRYY